MRVLRGDTTFVSTMAGIALWAIWISGCGNVQKSQTPPTLPAGSIVCWGDSMTAGDEGITDQGQYPFFLQQQIGQVVVNEGIGGQTSTQIGVRQGGIPTYVTVAGGMIPAYGAGGVTVTFKPGYEPLTSPNGVVHGSILGVHGNLTLSDLLPNGTFTFTRTSAGNGPVSAPGTPQYIPDQTYSSNIPIFWEGRNNILQTTLGPWGPQQVLSDIAAQVATVPSGENYLVLSILNENDPAERSGGFFYQNVIELNNSLSNIYGSHYLDVRSILVNAYDPTQPVDVTDHGYDMWPTSLSAITAQGTLVSSIAADDLAFPVNVTDGPPLRAGQILVIDQEGIEIEDTDGINVNLALRGYSGNAGSHSAGTAVIERDPTHLNKQGYALVAQAVANQLGVSSSQAALRHAPR